MFKAGLSPVDWMQMTRWQRLDLLARHRAEARQHMQSIKKEKFGGILKALLSRVLGV